VSPGTNDLQGDAGHAAREPDRLQRDDVVLGGGALRVETRGVETDGGIEGVEPAYFDMVGARPQLGRLLQPRTPLNRLARR
jgi:hypothetical protein